MVFPDKLYYAADCGSDFLISAFFWQALNFWQVAVKLLGPLHLIGAKVRNRHHLLWGLEVGRVAWQGYLQYLKHLCNETLCYGFAGGVRKGAVPMPNPCLQAEE